MNTPDLENAQTATPLPPQQVNASPHVHADAGETADSSSNAPASTLIEFPGANRNRPAWRKELSERVREIQQRRAREAALEAEEAARMQEAETGRAAFPEDDASLAADRAATKAEERAKQLGLVPPPPEMPEMNPLVVAALKRIERARTPPAPRGRAARATHAATAAARVVEEHYEPAPEAPPVAASKPPQREGLKAPAPPAEAATQTRELETKPDTARLPNLVAVPPKQPAVEKPTEPALPVTTAKASEEAAPVSTPSQTVVTSSSQTASTSSVPAATAPPPLAEQVERVEQKVVEKVSAAAQDSATTATAENSDRPQPRRVAGVIDDHWLERHGADSLPKVVTAKELYDDRASVVRRCAAALVDLVVVAFLSAPFAAVIELTIGNWGDPRVQASMGGVVLVMMFLYLTCSTALAGRTWGMSLFSLHTVDANSALAPTTGQCVRRTVVYMLSLATFGLGLLYALFDAEGRTAHDLLSRTVIVKE